MKTLIAQFFKFIVEFYFLVCVRTHYFMTADYL